MKALIIDEPWISRMLDGSKTWEMRSRSTENRGRFALIRKGSGQVVGVAELAGCRGPLMVQHKEILFAVVEASHFRASHRCRRTLLSLQLHQLQLLLNMWRVRRLRFSTLAKRLGWR